MVAVNLWFLDHPEASGIFNLGTGRAQPFNDVAARGRQRARAPSAASAPLPLAELVARRADRVHRLPAALVGKYQCFTAGRPRRAARAPAATTRSPTSRPASRRYVDWLRASDLRGPRARRGVNRRSRRPPLQRSSRILRTPTVHAQGDSHAADTRLALLVAAAAFAAVDVNKATQAELEAIKGIGPAISTQDPRRAQEGRLQGLERLHHARQGRRRRNAAKFSADGLTVNGEPSRRVDRRTPQAKAAQGRRHRRARRDAAYRRAKKSAPGAAASAPKPCSGSAASAGVHARPAARGLGLRCPAEEGAHLVAPRHRVAHAERDQLARVGRLEQQVAGQRRAARVVALARDADAAQQRADRQRQARQVARGDVVEALRSAR